MRLTSLLAVLILTLTAQPSQAAPAYDLWPQWDTSNEASTRVVDHSSWGDFLDEYLHLSSSGINEVAYASVSTGHRDALREYIDGIAAIDPRQLKKMEQLAYWINLYNALTVQLVLDNPDEKSIKGMGRGLFSFGPWDDELVDIAGEVLTLNDIEHRILRPIWQDHRIHYAVNCASIGCPNLNAEPYTAANAERLLDDGERDYINHERGVSFDGKGNVQLSKIYEWYGSDFADDERELLEYLSEHHASLSSELENHTGGVRYRYDWNLNQST